MEIRTLMSATNVGMPTVTGPMGSVTTPKPVITWTATTNAKSYDLWVDQIGGAKQFIRKTITGATSFSVPQSLPAGQYRVQVQAIDAQGRRSSWSVPTDFSVIPTPQLSGTKLTVNGTGNADKISVSQGRNLQVNVNGIDFLFTPGQVTDILIKGQSGNDTVVVNSLGTKKKLTIYGGDGDDVLTVAASVQAYAQIVGGEGNDRLTGGSGSDTLAGGTGDDRYYFNRTSANEIDTVVELADGGIDTLDFSGLSTTVSVDLTNDQKMATVQKRTIKTSGAGQSLNIENLTGGSGDDILKGNSAANKILGGKGQDRIDGLEGSDLLIGGEGDDIYDFNDALFSEHDVIVELLNAGIDTLSFSNMTGNVSADVSHDGVIATMVNRLITIGGPGQSANLENLTGGFGNDTLTGNSTRNVLLGSLGDDQLFGAGSNDVLNGGDGNDTLSGGAGDDSYLFGDAVSTQTDIIQEDANAGIDTLDFTTSTTAVEVNLGFHFDGFAHQLNRSITIPDQGFDAASEIENIIGGAGNDVLFGNMLANQIDGGEGDDKIDGRQGDDLLIGGSGNDELSGYVGNDRLQGGLGNDTFQFWYSAFDVGQDEILQDPNATLPPGNESDTVSFELFERLLEDGKGVIFDLGQNGRKQTVYREVINSSLVTVTIQLPQRHRIVNIVGSHSDDTIRGSALANNIDGMDGADKIFGLEGDDVLKGGGTLDGGPGNDVLIGGEMNDILVGGEGDDRVQGGAGNDRIYGGKGNDKLIGGAFDLSEQGGSAFDVEALGQFADANNDSIEGGEGNDILFGGAGSDKLIGGKGNDTYWFSTAVDTENDRVVENAGEGRDALDFRWLSQGDYVSSDLRPYTPADATQQVYMATTSSRTILGSGAHIDDVYGSPGNDTIVGNALNNRINGAAGDDFLAGWAGDDYIIASDFAGRVYSGEKNTLAGEDGTDLLVRLSSQDSVESGELIDGLDDESGTGSDERVRELLFAGPSTARAATAMKYSRRPTLIVAIQGAADSGRVIYEWEKELARNVSRSLNEAGSQTYVMVVQWDSMFANDNGVESVVGHIQDFLEERQNMWNVVLVGHSRGAIFANDVADQLGRPSHMANLVDILIDPTAAISMGDQYPAVTPRTVDGSVVYDDGFQFSPLGTVRDSLPVRNAEYRRQSLPDYGYYDTIATHMAIANWYAATGFAEDLPLFLKGNPAAQSPSFSSEALPHNANGYEIVDAADPDEHERVVDITIRADQNGNIHGTVSALGIGGMNVVLGNDGITVSGAADGVGGGTISIGQGIGASVNSAGVGPVSIGGGIQITNDESRIDLDAGPMRISLGTNGGYVDFGVKKVKFEKKTDLRTGTAVIESIGMLGETTVRSFLNGVAQTTRSYVNEDVMRDVINRLTYGKLAGQLEKVNVETLRLALDKVHNITEVLNASTITGVAKIVGNLTPAKIALELLYVKSEVLSSAIAILNDGRLDSVLSNLQMSELNALVSRMSTEGLKNALDVVVALRPAVLTQLSDLSALASAMDSASLQNLQAILSNLTTERIQAVLDRLASATISNAIDILKNSRLGEILNTMPSRRIAEVIPRLSSSALSTVAVALNDGKAALVLIKLGTTVQDAMLATLSESRIAGVLGAIGTDSIGQLCSRLSNERLADVVGIAGDSVRSSILSAVSGDQLRAVVSMADDGRIRQICNVLSDSRIRQVLGAVDGNVLSKVAGQVSDERLRRLLEGADSSVVDKIRSVLPTDRLSQIGGPLIDGIGGVIGGLGGLFS